MMCSESRSVLLAEFHQGSEETEIVMELEEFLLSPESQQQRYFKLLVLQNSESTSKHLRMLPHWIHSSLFHLIHYCSHDKRGSGEREKESEKKEQCSLASRVTEWHFYDVSQIIPWDGWAELEHQLINPSTDGMCCGHPPAQLFFPCTEHSARHAGEND